MKELIELIKKFIPCNWKGDYNDIVINSFEIKLNELSLAYRV